MLTEKTKIAILNMQKQYPKKRSALIPALHLAQGEAGYLPLEIQDEIAELFDLAPNEVYAVVTFYDMFYERPTGKHHVHVCKNISCMLRGSDETLKKLCEKLNVSSENPTSEDGEFTIIASECLAACDRAPMILADDKVYGPVHAEDVDKLLEEIKKSPGHASPIAAEGAGHA